MTTHPAAAFLFLTLSLVLTGCRDGANITEADGADGSSGDSGADPDATGPASTESTGEPLVMCGAPTDDASTDAQIAALEGCEVYLGALSLESGVSSVAPLASLRVIGGELLVGGTDSPLTTLAGLEQLESVGELTLAAHYLANLQPLQRLQEVKGDFTALSMFNLVDFRGLESLRIVEGNFLLLANPMLTSVDGLDGLEEVHGDFEAGSSMTPLPRSEVQALVDRIAIGGMVNID